MLTGYSQNEHGTWQSEHVCDTCGREFTLIPAAGANTEQEQRWGNCLATDCDSYDPRRDVDLLFDAGMSGAIKRREKRA